MKRVAESSFIIRTLQLDSNLKPAIDYKKCIICQKIKEDEEISTPKPEGYVSLSRDFSSFLEFKIDSVPSHIVSLFENANQFQELLTIFKAVYHKKCRNEYNIQKFNRLVTKCKKSRISADSGIEPSETPRQIFPHLCIFCKDDDFKTHLATTKVTPDVLSHFINQAETNMDVNMVNQLKNSSTMAEFKYHKKCQIKFFKAKTITPSTVEEQPNFRDTFDLVYQDIIKHIEKSRHSSETEFFKLSHLAKAMSARLHQIGFEDYIIHTTRLKDQLLSSISGLRADKIGREILLSFDDNVKYLVSNALDNDMNDKQMFLDKASDIIKETFKSDNEIRFSGSLNETFCAKTTVSKTLVNFVLSLIGPGAASLKVAENIAQIIQYNSVTTRKAEAAYIRHNIHQEQPLPIYLALLVHSVTGKRKLVDEMFEMGLCVSYTRIMDIERALATKVCEKYIEDDCVCPPNLMPELFTTAAMDNIDHNPQSTSANYSFHGTGISLIQHYDHPNNEEFQQNIQLDKSDFANKKNPSLPKSYYEIPSLPALVGERPLSTTNWELETTQKNPMEYVQNWLQDYNKSMNEAEYNQVISWSAYNSRLCFDISSHKSVSTMLPLIKEDINSSAVVQHAMDIIISATKKLNPLQNSAITGDQPVYAIAKQLQWLYPKKYGEDKVVLMLGGLHIEKSFLAVIGDWLEGSGWEEALVKCSIATPGRSEAILKASHIKRARYAHEVSIVALSILLYETFKAESDYDDSKYFEWIEEKRQDSPQFQFWVTTMELEAILLQFVKTLRTADFDEYVSVLEQMCPWYLVADHPHYGRYLSVFVDDMKRLPVIQPEIYKEFKKGHFTSRRTNKHFSCISDDQFHEQNNKFVKESSSLLGVLNEESALVKWMVSGPEISRLIWEYRNISTKNEDLRHHEDSKWFQSKFAKNVKDLVVTFRNKGPFSTKELTTIGNDRKTMDADSVKNVLKASNCGKLKYQEFVRDRLVTTKESIHRTIKQSQLSIFKIKAPKKINKDKLKLAAANMDSNLFCRLFIACESRKGNVTEFFKHENTRYPPSLSEFGALRLPTSKDDMLTCLSESNKTIQCQYEDVNPSAVIINIFSLVQNRIPTRVMTVKEYSDDVFDKLIDNMCNKYSLVDIVFDVNQENSLDEMIKQDCSIEKYVSLIDNDTKLSSSKTWFAKFLNNTKTKTQLLKVMASNFLRCSPKADHIVFGTDEHVIISKREISHIQFRLPIENINTRILLHVEHAVRNGHQKILISTTDSHVVVVALYAFKYLAPDLKKLWVELVHNNAKSVVSIHELFEFHKDKTEILPFFNAFTGYITTSTLFGIGKIIAWKAWKKFPALDAAILQLVKNGSPTLCKTSMNVLEKFTILMYDSSCKMTKLEDCRRFLFTKPKPRTIDRIPPTRDALEQHVKRSMLQANLWMQCVKNNIRQLDVADWGWGKDDNSTKYNPIWTTIPTVVEHCRELTSCKCKKNKCTRSCPCVKIKFKCTLLCDCEARCNTEHLLN